MCIRDSYFTLNNPDAGLLQPGLWDMEGYLVTIKMTYRFVPMIEGGGEGTTQFERSTAMTNEINFNFIGQGDLAGYKGDMNNDSAWDIIDVVMLSTCVLDQNCFDAYGWQGDMDSNETYNILDVIVLGGCIIDSNCHLEYGPNA